MSDHSRAWCHVCSWAYSGPDADRKGHLHTTSKAQGHIQHATGSASHPKSLCTDECTIRPPRGRN